MRRIASQVPDSVGRLIQSGHIKSPPTWYAAVLANPPPQITARRQKIQKRLDPKGQVSDELPRLFKVKGAMRAPKLRIQQIRYREDEIRRKFYQDFPFEAMRPATLVEMREIQEEHAIRGEAWTALAQRGAYPTVEDTIEFTIKLNDEGMSLSNAYVKATGEFVKLRARYEMAQIASELEARHHGAEFSETPIERHFRKEREYLDAHLDAQNRTASHTTTRIRWKPPKERKWTTHIDEHALLPTQFTGGRDYVARWKAPFLSGSAEGEASAHADSADEPFISGDAEDVFGEGFEAESETISDLDFLRQSVDGKDK